MSRVAVLGCGPAGLGAAHAARVAGLKADVFSVRRKSEMFGAQYLHKPLPGMTETAPVPVRVVLMGTHDDYRRRVYGDQADDVPVVSTEDLPPEHDAWDIRSTYENMWLAYADQIREATVDAAFVANLLLAGEYDQVFSTIPLPALCADREHTFTSQDIWALGDAPERGVFASDIADPGNNVIICNGNGAASWYRAAKVFGRTTVEWPLTAADAPPDASRVRKPLANDCDCWDEVVRLGRYGKWEKGVLVHHAYEEALEACLVL